MSESLNIAKIINQDLSNDFTSILNQIDKESNSILYSSVETMKKEYDSFLKSCFDGNILSSEAEAYQKNFKNSLSNFKSMNSQKEHEGNSYGPIGGTDIDDNIYDNVDDEAVF